MSWLYLPGQAVGCLEADCLDGELSATSSMTNTASTCLQPESETGISMTPQSGTTLEPSTGVPGLDAWILSLPVSHASPLVGQAGSLESKTLAISGLIPFALWEKSGPNGSYWRMSQGCFPTLMFDEFSETWPRAGTMRRGIAYRRAPLAPRTSEIGSGLWPTPRRNTGPSMDRKHLSLDGAVKLWPTPVVSRGDYAYSHGRKVLKLSGAVKMFPTPTATNTKVVHLRTNGRPPRSYLPTPTANDVRQRFNTSPGSDKPRPNLAAMAKYSLWLTPMATNWKNRETCDHSRDLKKAIGGQLNPNWVEWLMGWPIGWTALEPLATGRFRQWLELHGII